jgi:hypothetical protein
MSEMQQNSYAGWGMVMGTAIGAGLGGIVLALTGEPWWIIVAGAGTGIGLALGSSIDRFHAERKERACLGR